MFHNYFFLKRLARELDQELANLELLECFSQSKDELILGFASANKTVYIRANLEPQIGLIQIMDDFKRAKRNSADLFTDLIGVKVVSANVFQYERSFWIDFENGMSLIFKMHGSRSNILLSENDKVKSLFRSVLENDLEIKPSELYKHLDLSPDRFNSLEGNPNKFIPALGKEVKNYLTRKGYFDADLNERWKQLQALLELLDTNQICVLNEPKPNISLLESTCDGPLASAISATNELYIRFTKNHYLTSAKSSVIKPLEDQIKKTENYISNTEEKLFKLLDRRGYDEIANILMANLHLIQKGQETVTLDDFYSNEKIDIKLNPELSPQKNAENLYRKAKNQNLEIANLETNIQSRKVKLEELKKKLEEVSESEDIKSLRKESSSQQSSKKEENLPYHPYLINGYQVFVGKNARHNDELTLKVANKNDLWLHAKDVAGSHVLIRDQAGKKIPKDVIEAAAQLAAWYSKRKTDSLCPVIYTPKKYIRKRKGDPPGAVVVEKENVMMVVPKNFDNSISI